MRGRVVLDLESLDEDRNRLLASFAYQASVALQKARLYWKQLEAAEIANALLDASRELATAESPEEVLGRSAEVTARVLGTRRAALWIEEEAEPRDLIARASFGFTREDDPARPQAVPERARARVARAHRSFRPRAGGHRGGAGRRRDGCRARRRRAAQARGQPRCRADRHDRRPSARRPPARAARRPRAPGEARDRERGALREPRAHLRLDRRGARERARGERRVHVVARALDHRHVAARRQGARASTATR